MKQNEASAIAADADVLGFNHTLHNQGRHGSVNRVAALSKHVAGRASRFPARAGDGLLRNFGFIPAGLLARDDMPTERAQRATGCQRSRTLP
jgi:hypothetical protein